MSQVLPKIPGAARVPAEAIALAGAPEPRASEARPSSESEASDTPIAVAERATMPSLPPALARVGRYDVLGRIAVGGMAEIYLAREPVETGALRHVAIKVLKQSSTQQDGSDGYFEELFLREGRTAAQLVHPNICHVYEFGKWSGYFYIAMEWIEGSSLRHVLTKLAKRKKTMPPSLAVGIAAQVAGALHYAHTVRDARRRALQVVHLDVNPQNIMLRHDGVVKLLDFGIAQVADPRGDSRSDVVKGKVGYIAPEQALQQPLDRRVDVFGLGACLFEMLSGRPAYRRESMRDSLEALLAQPVPSVREWVPEIPAELDDIVRKAIAREPRERFQTAGELQAALEGYLARSREVVSGRHIAQLMESITPAATTSLPALYTGPEVVSRLAGDSDVPFDAGYALPRAGSRRALRLTLACLGVALGVLLAYFALDYSHGAAGSSAPAELAQPAPVRPPVTPTLPARPAAAATNAALQVSPTPPPVDTAPAKARAPAGARPKSDVPKGKRANRRRIKPGFVADPGF